MFLLQDYNLILTTFCIETEIINKSVLSKKLTNSSTTTTFYRDGTKYNFEETRDRRFLWRKRHKHSRTEDQTRFKNSQIRTKFTF